MWLWFNLLQTKLRASLRRRWQSSVDSSMGVWHCILSKGIEIDVKCFLKRLRRAEKKENGGTAPVKLYQVFPDMEPTSTRTLSMEYYVGGKLRKAVFHADDKVAWPLHHWQRPSIGLRRRRRNIGSSGYYPTLHSGWRKEESKEKDALAQDSTTTIV